MACLRFESFDSDELLCSYLAQTPIIETKEASGSNLKSAIVIAALLGAFSARFLDQLLDSATSPFPGCSFAPIHVLLVCLFMLAWFQIFHRPYIVNKTMSATAKATYCKEVGILPPYPTAWYKLCDSRDLAVGKMIPFHVFGRDLVVFRCEGDANGAGRGNVFVTGAVCPHLGANVGIGGQVKGNCIECPFHGWKFDGASGKVSDVPYRQKKSNPDVGLETFPCVEVNHQIFVWYDAGNSSPSWAIPEFMHSEMVFHGRTSHEIAALGMQEIAENGADTAHLGFLHSPFIFSVPGFSHHWSATWNPRDSSDQRHVVDIHLDTGVAFMGRKLSFASTHVHIVQLGPSQVYLQFSSPFGKLIVNETLLPLGPRFIRAHNSIYSDRWVPRWLAKVMLFALATQFERDISLWNHKKYLQRPAVHGDDGPILRYRRWFSQFYPQDENGNRISKRESVADW